MNTAETELLATTDRLREQQLAWTRDLIAIPTVNPYSGDDSAGSEVEGQKWYAQTCRNLGGAVRHVPVPEDVYKRAGMIGIPNRRWQDRENVVAEWQFGQGGPTVILNTHMDTVGTDGMAFDPFDPRVHDGTIYGRGSSDSKGNLVVGLIALAALKQHATGLNGRIILESVVDEECNGAGAGTLACCLSGITADFCICLDGSTEAIHNGCNGITTPKVTVYGRAGHAASGGTAVNAIDKAFQAKQAVDRFAEQHLEKHPDCRVNLGVFRSGTLPAIVPSVAELQFNISYAVEDARTAEQTHGVWNGAVVHQRFETMLAKLGETDAWFKEKPVKVEWLKDSYPFYSPADDKYSQTVIGAVHELAQRETPVRSMPAWFDAAHLSRILKKPVLGIGSGTPGKAHGAEESAQLEDLYRGARYIALAVHRLLDDKGGHP